MEHFNKHSFIGEQIWSAIKSLVSKDTYTKHRFEYIVNNKTIYCENYGNDCFAIREIKSKALC
jgi:hypothetical protein